MNARMRGPVRVVGAGLLGASIGLALRERGIDVILADASRAEPHARRSTTAPVAPRPPDDAPALVVVACRRTSWPRSSRPSSPRIRTRS